MAVIGVDVGGTKMAAGVSVAGSRLEAVVRAATPPHQEDLVEGLVALVLDAVAASPEPVRAVGVGVPSLIDRASGHVLMSVNAELAGLALRPLLQERLGLPVAVDNDGNLAVLAEQRAGAARGRQNVALLTLGTGIGGGLVLDGEVYRGGRGTGAELGHITVQADGPPCQGHCPNHGCLETFVSGTAIAREAGGRDAPTVARLADEGDPEAAAVLERAGRWLGVGLATLANVLNPDVFVIGGGVGEVGERILVPARAELAARALPPNADAPVLAAAFGNQAGMVGGAMLARSLLAAGGTD